MKYAILASTIILVGLSTSMCRESPTDAFCNIDPSGEIKDGTYSGTFDFGGEFSFPLVVTYSSSERKAVGTLEFMDSQDYYTGEFQAQVDAHGKVSGTAYAVGMVYEQAVGMTFAGLANAQEMCGDWTNQFGQEGRWHLQRVSGEQRANDISDDGCPTCQELDSSSSVGDSSEDALVKDLSDVNWADVQSDFEVGEVTLAHDLCDECGGCCTPACDGKECGDDGCGGSCGLCGTNQVCGFGECSCVPFALSCGNECCLNPQMCIQGACCLPDCAGKECGFDGCGGSCGWCSGYQECSPQAQCVSSIGLVWIPILGGSFVMGCSPNDTCADFELPSHAVTVSSFEMLETEVTEAQYEAVMGKNPSCDIGDPDNPVECMLWFEAKAFCEAVGGRLPTEAEWEYAARGGTTTKYYCGDSSSCLDGIAWYDSNSGGHKHDAKGKEPNAYGLYDMLGNVWEWVEDCWHSSYNGAPSTGYPAWTSSCDSLRVMRGAAFDDPGYPLSFRYSVPWDYHAYDLGARCAKSVEP